MMRNMLLSKLHHARVTQADLEYEGSFGIDEEILLAADIKEYEQVHIYNLENGERFATYAIKAPFGSRIMQANGACAHKVKIGDRVIICTYGMLAEVKISSHQPKILMLSKNNDFKIKEAQDVKNNQIVENISKVELLI